MIPYKDIWILFTTRSLRLFFYGFLSVILALYLSEIGLSAGLIGLLFTFTLAGDAAITLWLTTSADTFGRKRTLLIGALLMMFAGVVFIITDNLLILIAAAIIGVLSPSGNEIGPFLSVEQAAFTQLLPDTQRTRAFAWYNLAGSFSTALGALTSGGLAQVLIAKGLDQVAAYRIVLLGYAMGGFILFALFLLLSKEIELKPSAESRSAPRLLGLHRSRATVFQLAGLFALDAFAGGLVIQSMLSYWFHIKYGLPAGVLGSIFFGANILAGISALLAVRLARQIGLIRTMVFTHIPSNFLLMLVPLMPGLSLAIIVLLLRYSISQMDVPTRQSYTMAVVAPDERSAASGVTTIARSIGAVFSPALSGLFLTSALLFNLPFFLAGGLKIVYDLLLYRKFVTLKPPEEASV